MGRLIVVTGVGTEIGKTTLAVAVVGAAADAGLRVAGYKPVESGLAEGGGDAAALARVATFHVKPSPLYAFSEPISPHLAAERTGTRIDLQRIASVVASVRSETDLTVVELAGGLFSPLGPIEDNVDLVLALAPAQTLLVVVDALGALHHARACSAAAAARGLRLEDLALVAPQVPDASTGTNERYLSGIFRRVHRIPRLPRALLRACPAVREVAADPGPGAPASR